MRSSYYCGIRLYYSITVIVLLPVRMVLLQYVWYYYSTYGTTTVRTYSSTTTVRIVLMGHRRIADKQRVTAVWGEGGVIGTS